MQMELAGEELGSDKQLKPPEHERFCPVMGKGNAMGNVKACTGKPRAVRSRLTEDDAVMIYRMKEYKTPKTAGLVAAKYKITAKAVRECP